MKTRKIHKKCGGVVRQRICSKCEKTWSKMDNLFQKDIRVEEIRFDPEEYRRRIRERRDIR